MPAPILARPAATDYADYYTTYISRVPAGDLLAIMEGQITTLRDLLAPLPAHLVTHRSGPGKWTLGEVIGHLTDNERVFSYRALAFARRDPSPLPSFDQDAWVAATDYSSRTLTDLLDEWIAARRSAIAMVCGLHAAALQYTGIASDNPITVLAAITVLPGHVTHHLEVLQRDYFPHTQ